jgi:hypothetical protein
MNIICPTSTRKRLTVGLDFMRKISTIFLANHKFNHFGFKLSLNESY